MDHPIVGARALLLAAAIASPLAVAQEIASEQPTEAAAASGSEVDIDLVGEVVVVGRKDQNLQQATTQVIAVLSAEDIARTGDGDVAGALSRVTGLSVAGNGFVYVRGLGDRYSQAYLNGSPLPSPEPLRRAGMLRLADRRCRHDWAGVHARGPDGDSLRGEEAPGIGHGAGGAGAGGSRAWTPS